MNKRSEIGDLGICPCHFTSLVYIFFNIISFKVGSAVQRLLVLSRYG